MTKRYQNTAQFIAQEAPIESFYCLSKQALENQVQRFISGFSGVVAYADPETWIADTLRPWVEHTIECFGWDRVVWGSDWPVCTLGGGLMPWIAATHALLDGASDDEKRKLLSENATRIWGL